MTLNTGRQSSTPLTNSSQRVCLQPFVLRKQRTSTYYCYRLHNILYTCLEEGFLYTIVCLYFTGMCLNKASVVIHQISTRNISLVTMYLLDLLILSITYARSIRFLVVRSSAADDATSGDAGALLKAECNLIKRLRFEGV